MKGSPLCIHCSVPPERREQPQTGLVMYICPACNNRGEATRSEAQASSSWSLVNLDDLPAHGCKSGGVPRVFSKAGKWGIRCPGCDYLDHGYATIHGARAGWARCLR